MVAPDNLLLAHTEVAAARGSEMRIPPCANSVRFISQRLYLGVLTPYFATPAQQLSVCCYERSIVHDSSDRDKTVGGVAMQIFKFDREQRDISRKSQLNYPRIEQLRS